jgi:hypothetical protein
LRPQRKLARVLVLLFAIHETCVHGLTLSRFARTRNSCCLRYRQASEEGLAFLHRGTSPFSLVS